MTFMTQKFKKAKFIFRILGGFVFPLLLAAGCSSGNAPKLSKLEDAAPPSQLAVGQQYMVATENAEASKIGSEILRRGGNAADAAVSVSFALSVLRPQSTGLGGGGFLLLHNARTDKLAFLDFRERAPLKANYKDFEQVRVNRGIRYKHHPLYTGVPGVVAGMYELYDRFGSGKFTWEELLAPAIKLADKGFEAYPHLEDARNYVASKTRVLDLYPRTRVILSQAGKFINKDLARTLKRIAKKGPSEFYIGQTAEEIIKAVKSEGGLLEAEDLRIYRPVYREPVIFKHAGYEIASAPLPSSGGILLADMFGMLDLLDYQNVLYASPEDYRLRVEVMKQAFQLRAEKLGDSSFFPIEVQKYLSEKFIEHQVGFIKNSRKEKKPALINDSKDPTPTSTSHFSIVDRQGNVISSTQSVNLYFGSGVVAGKAGFFLNNTLDDFSFSEANEFGLLGSDANRIMPGKTPLSSMSPTIVLRRSEDGKRQVVLALGSPGGPQIISSVFNVLLNMIDHHLDLFGAVKAPRLHHQWQPDKVYLEENGFSKKAVTALESGGYQVHKVSYPVGNISAVYRSPEGLLYGVSDPRRRGIPSGK